MGLYYPLSKTQAEKWAWDFVGGGGEGEGGKGEGEGEGKGKFRLVVMNPTLITGPVLQAGMNTSTVYYYLLFIIYLIYWDCD